MLFAGFPVVLGLLVVGCDDESTEVGPGPIEPVGPIDVDEKGVLGSGGYDGGDLASRKARVEGFDTDESTLWVTGELELVVSESATVAYYGSPAVDQNVSGLVTVTSSGGK